MSTNMTKINWPGWETVRLIGRGSFGTVYEIQRDVFGDIEKAALKVISIPQNASDIDEMYSDGYDDESITSTFQSHLKSIVAEYSLMRKMNGSANIVNCDDIRYVQHDDGIGWDIFIKMELLTPLTKAIPASIPEETVIKIAKDMCTALELCKKHEIVHRDIKPQNIFVSPNGDYKLGDFGIAKTVEKTMGGTKIGTYKYMAPEVYNNQPYGTSADIYSLGLVLYWLLNERRMPFLPLPPEKLKAGMDESARNRRLSGEQLPPPVHGGEWLKRIILKACAYDPAERYSSAVDMLKDLNEGFLDEETRRRNELEQRKRIAREQAERERLRREKEEQERLLREREEAERHKLIQEAQEQQRKLPEHDSGEHASDNQTHNSNLRVVVVCLFLFISVVTLFCISLLPVNDKHPASPVLSHTSISILTQPTDVVVAAGDMATVTVEAQGEGLTYAWYIKPANGSDFSHTTSFTGDTYSVEMNVFRNGRQVYCVITDAYGNSVQTNTVTLGMATPVKIVTQPVSVTVAEGRTATVTVEAQGEGLTYEWYFRNAGDSDFSYTDSFTGNSYSVEMSAARDGRQIYCVITDANGNSVQTDTVTISMTASLRIVTQPVSVTVAEGQTATVTVEAVGEGLTYEWYYRNADPNPYDFEPTTAFTGPTYSVEMNSTRSGRQIYCVITDAYGNTVRTNTVTINMR